MALISGSTTELISINAKYKKYQPTFIYLFLIKIVFEFYLFRYNILISIFFLVLTHRPFKKSTQSHYCTFLSKKCTLKIYPIITVKMYNFDGD